MPGAVAPSAHVTTLAIVVLAGYFVAAMAVGFAVTRRSGSVGGFTAAMSTVSASLNSSATIILSDYYQRHVNPRADEPQYTRVLHQTTLLWGAAGTAAAVAMTEARGALDTWRTLAGIFGGGTLGLFLLGSFSRSAGNRAAQAEVAAGVLLIVDDLLPAAGRVAGRMAQP